MSVSKLFQNPSCLKANNFFFLRKKLKGSFKTYEQEALVKSFLKENSAFRPIGQNKRGDIVLQKNNRVVQITAKGKIIK